MADQQLPSQARQFIRDRITSVAQLELLLLLRTNPARAWTANELSSELRVQPTWARTELDHMCSQGLLSKTDDPEPHFCYRPATAELEDSVTAVAQAYLVHRVSVVEMIYSRSTDTIRAFADAFKLRRTPPDG